MTMTKIYEAVGLQQQGDEVTIRFTSTRAAADFFNAHTVSVAVEVPTLIREVRGLCRDVREHDETYCATCGLRWSNDEEKPECPK